MCCRYHHKVRLWQKYSRKNESRVIQRSFTTLSASANSRPFSHHLNPLPYKKEIHRSLSMLTETFLVHWSHFSVRSGKAVDIEKALEYPLCPIPLSIANADGSRRQTSKSKLMEVLKSYTEISGLTCCDESSMTSIAAVVIDFIALVRTMVEIPNTFEGLGIKTAQVNSVWLSKD